MNVKVPSANRFNDEPSVGLLIETFAIDERGNAIQAGIEKTGFRRGDVVNLVKDTEYVGPGYIDTQEKFPFLTGMTLLDIDGGTKLTPGMSVPARILLMGPAGQLYIRNELEDEPFVEHHRLLFAKPNRKTDRLADESEEDPHCFSLEQRQEHDCVRNLRYPATDTGASEPRHSIWR